MEAKFDFSGYATKIGLRCSDGRTITKDAFKHHDGQKVPLVWQHVHDAPTNILGQAVLEHRDDGVYAYCSFNNSEAAKSAKEAVRHGDITAMSIYANGLKQQGSNVMHGVIREVSLVLAGANPGALIDNLAFAHGDGLDPVIDDTEAIIYTGLNFSTDTVEHSEESPDKEEPEKEEPADDESLTHASYSENATVKEVFDSLDETQKNVVYAIIGEALSDGNVKHSEQEGDNVMKANVFDKGTEKDTGPALTHDQMSAIFTDAKRMGSLKEAVLAHAATYGVENIEVLFPDARSVRNMPDMVKRDDSWVRPFLNAIYKTPFSRIKSLFADLKEDEARARGYITGNRKKEEVFPVLKRITTPTTIYKKQRLDRDDIIDITDFDVVVWLRGEMREMLNEELARAALIGDGREPDDEDHINTLNIRPIWTDDEIYAPKITLDANTTVADTIDEIVRARKLYKGSGSPTFYTTEETVTDMLLLKDLNQHRIYPTVTELASALRVSNIVAVEVMEDQKRTLPNSTDVVDLVGILVNPRDYTMGADRGGEVSMFDDFDIDYNQYKYLIETRVSGALTKPKSAVVIEKMASAG